MASKSKRPPGVAIRGGRGVSQHRREHARKLAHTGSLRIVAPVIDFDPFARAGTVWLVAECLGRDSMLVEINPDCVDMGRGPIADDGPLLTQPKGVA